MTAILEIPEVRRRISPLTVEEYHRLDEFNERGRRTELFRGILIEKMSKSPLHRTVSSLLFKLIAAQLPKGYSVWKEEPLTFKEMDSEPEPELSVVRGTDMDFLEAHPHTGELIVEVAVSSPELDRENASLYAEAGVKEYWIVLAPSRQVEVYRRPRAGVYQEKKIFGVKDVVECAAVPGVRISVREIFP